MVTGVVSGLVIAALAVWTLARLSVMTDYTVTLRDAVPDDAEAGAALQRNCWREAYGGLAADPALLQARLADVGRWVRALAQPARSPVRPGICRRGGRAS